MASPDHSGFGRAVRWLATPRLLHWLLPYLMALVALGTVQQKTIGLYETQRRYFDAYLLGNPFAALHESDALAWLPLPGGRLVCALLLVSLLAKIIVASPWSRAKAGIFIAHLGVALLLIGGLVTTFFSAEGYVALGLNDRAASFSDYHAREVAISKNGAIIQRVAFEDIVRGREACSHPPLAGDRIRSFFLADSRGWRGHSIPPPPQNRKGDFDPPPAGGAPECAALPFTLTITQSCANCTMAHREGGAKLHGAAQKVQLAPLPPETDNERNLAGIEFAVSGAGAADGGYLAFEPMPTPPEFTVGDDTYRVSVGRVQHPLPFSLTLLEAEKQVYPGTETPRSYRSIVLLRDGAIEQRAELTMNHPLRYKGYTVYQSSFITSDQGQMVSFAVVRNAGRVFPYAASVTLCIGLLIHLALRLPKLMGRGA